MPHEVALPTAFNQHYGEKAKNVRLMPFLHTQMKRICSLLTPRIPGDGEFEGNPLQLQTLFYEGVVGTQMTLISIHTCLGARCFTLVKSLRYPASFR